VSCNHIIIAAAAAAAAAVHWHVCQSISPYMSVFLGLALYNAS